MQLRTVASALLMAVLAGPTMAASFDCSRAGNYAEKEICRDGYLSGLDDRLARSYKAALAVNPEQTQAVQQSQREWLQTRNTCTEQKCLDKAIGARITALENYVTAEKGKAFDARAQAQQAPAREAEAARQQELAERAAAQQQAHAARLEAQRQQAAATPPLYQPAQQVAQPVQGSNSTADVTASQQIKTWWQKFKDGPAWKYAVVALALLTAWAMWRHHQGVTTIYNDYTDAAISNLLPAAGVLTGLLLKWLELPRELTSVVSVTGFVLALMFAIYASIRTNDGVLNFLLSLIAKLTLISVFYAVILFLVASLFSSTKYKGESQARADARNRRQRKQTMALIAGLTTAYTFLSAWLCRRQEFVPLGECLSFEPVPAPA